MPIKLQQFIPKLKIVAKRGRTEKTPQEKIADRLALIKKKGLYVKKYHFQIIEHGAKALLFNGFGEFISESSYNTNGIRSLRDTALNMFLNADEKDKQGGYKITVNFSVKEK